MDGLTVSTSQSLLEKGQTASELRQSSLNRSSDVKSSDKSFADTLKDSINKVNELQQKSDHLIEQLATGKSKNIPEVMIAAEKADIAMKLMVQVRNKIINAYQEIMKMQV
ncbi:MAG: flagellar hook-basal body complex protein FliE [Bdellovibrionales bacterium]|nr:flagellar hook-basal body complex protein FliE [Bdellovibrionales bacterium]